LKRSRLHRRHTNQRVVTSFSYDPDKAEILEQAALIASKDDLSFSEWLMSVIEEKVQQQKNLEAGSCNPLNVYYEQRPIKTLDDILAGLVTLDDFISDDSKAITADDAARIEGKMLTLHQKAKQRYMEARKREMFNR
jgi:hypothetical protein